MKDPTIYLPVDAFCDRIGLSKQRLYQLWKKRVGPPRFELQVGTLQTRVLIPEAEGLAWEAERQKTIHPNNKRVAAENRERGARMRDGQRALRDVQRQVQAEFKLGRAGR